MPLRLFPVLMILTLCSGAVALAQTRVRTETIRPPAAPKAEEKPSGNVTPPAQRQTAANPEVISDLARLPAPVARMRERILAAAKSGDLQKVVSVMQSSATMPIFSLSNEKNPLPYWKSNYPDSDGIEVLSILVTILEAPFVHVEKGTPQEVFLWPYFARMRLKDLTPEQKVELFRIVTGTDYKDMLEFGAYNFYRLGIGPDGTWHFFVSGD